MNRLATLTIIVMLASGAASADPGHIYEPGVVGAGRFERAVTMTECEAPQARTVAQPEPEEMPILPSMTLSPRMLHAIRVGG